MVKMNNIRVHNNNKLKNKMLNLINNFNQHKNNHKYYKNNHKFYKNHKLNLINLEIVQLNL